MPVDIMFGRVGNLGGDPFVCDCDGGDDRLVACSPSEYNTFSWKLLNTEEGT